MTGDCCGERDHLAVTGYYSEEDVDLQGDVEGLRALADVLSTSAPVSRCVLCVPAGASPAPHEGFLSALEVVQGAGPVTIERTGHVLVMRGAAEHLGTIAVGMRSFADYVERSPYPGEHWHVEHIRIPGYHIASSALPLIVTFVDKGAACP